MKSKYIFICCLLVILSSCLKDKTNYNIAEDEVITIKGIDPAYAKVSAIDKLSINPEVTSSKPNADFEYLWTMYETNVATGVLPKLDTLGKVKVLDYEIVQIPKNWVLVFKATNKKTGYSQYATSTISIVTPFSRGWYVTKGVKGKTDLDLFLTPKTITPESKKENVFSLINGRQINGSPVQSYFFDDFMSNILNPASYLPTRTLMLITENDASAIDLNSMREYSTIKDLLYDAPSNPKPMFLSTEMTGYYLNVNGGLHAIYNWGNNSGKFGGTILKDGDNTPYQLSKYCLTDYYISFFFDDLSSSFVSAGVTGSTLIPVKDAPTTQLPGKNNNMKMLYWGMHYNPAYSGVAVMQDKTNPTIKKIGFISYSFQSVNNFKVVTTDIDPSSKLYNAEKYTVLVYGEDMLYFTIGREVWSRNLANGFEQLQYTVPEGETISFIKHRFYTEATGSPYNYNYVMIGSSNGTNYKVRMFKKQIGNLLATPDFTLEGAGSAGDVIYISPLIYSDTYSTSY